MIRKHPERKGEVSTKWTKFANDVLLNTITDIEFKSNYSNFPVLTWQARAKLFTL